MYFFSGIESIESVLRFGFFVSLFKLFSGSEEVANGITLGFLHVSTPGFQQKPIILCRRVELRARPFWDYYGTGILGAYGMHVLLRPILCYQCRSHRIAFILESFLLEWK